MNCLPKNEIQGKYIFYLTERTAVICMALEVPKLSDYRSRKAKNNDNI